MVGFETTSSDPPLLVEIKQLSSTILFAEFDRDLVPGSLLASNWSGDLGGFPFIVVTAVAAGVGVVLTVAVPQTTIPADRVAYAATPADVRSLDGNAPAAAFTDEPIIP